MSKHSITGNRCRQCGCAHLVVRGPNGKHGYNTKLPTGERRVRYCRNCGRRVVLKVEIISG